MPEVITTLGLRDVEAAVVEAALRDRIMLCRDNAGRCRESSEPAHWAEACEWDTHYHRAEQVLRFVRSARVRAHKDVRDRSTVAVSSLG